MIGLWTGAGSLQLITARVPVSEVFVLARGILE